MAEKLGRFVATGQQPLQSVIDSALDQSWGNTATNISTIKVPEGTTIYQGYAAQQGGLVG
jgi:filamentous hemagglutinin